MAKAVTKTKDKVLPFKRPAARRSAHLSVVKKSRTWWQGAKEPKEVSTLQLAQSRLGFGGDYLILWPGKEDGQELINRKIGRMEFESIKKRTVSLIAHKIGGESKRWGLHKVRLLRNFRPHVHFPIQDGLLKTVKSKVDQNEVKLRFEGDRVLLDLPPSLR